MTEGLITRIGRWIDTRWAPKATEAQLGAVQLILESRLANLETTIKHMELGELKTRMEKMELYSGMTRKVDPTKAAVAKSAFSM